METVDALNKQGRKAAMLHFNNIFPIPEGDWQKVLNQAKRTVCVESNAMGQFARLLRMETGHSVDQHIGRYDGRPLNVPYILERLDG